MDWDSFREEKDASLLGPMFSWLQKCEEGEEPFTMEDVKLLGICLDEFVDDLELLGKKAIEDDIMDATEKALNALNTLDENTDHTLIGLEEQEYIKNFMNRAARHAGWDNDEDDVTEEWWYW